MHVYADEIVSIADEAPPMYVDEKGVRCIDNAGVQQQRLRVEARKWIASKLAPKVFGDQIAVTGPEGAPLIGLVDDIELARQVCFMPAKIGAQNIELTELEVIADASVDHEAPEG